MSRVLHIEDDPMNRLLVRKLLAADGHEVIDAATGLEGIRLARARLPDIVLVDINIPDLDGYEVTLRLRSMSQMHGVPIVAITAEGDKVTSHAVGADGFIQKPIDARHFPSLIDDFLSGHTERTDIEGDPTLLSRSQKIVERLEGKVVELSEANERLKEMARLRREFLQNLSHEFATPMTPVVGYLRLLQNEELGPLTPLQRKCIESINASIHRLRSLIDTLLDVSHLETGRMHLYERDYDLSEVVERAISETSDQYAQAGVNLVRDVPESLAARGDPDKLGRALVHILDNAVKFTPRGGDVAIGVSASEHDYRVSIVDSGPGISAADRERILEPFFQVDGSATRNFGGVGLGLAFARRVAEAMGGGIEVQSPPEASVAGQDLGGTAITLRVLRHPPTTDAS